MYRKYESSAILRAIKGVSGSRYAIRRFTTTRKNYKRLPNNELLDKIANPPPPTPSANLSLPWKESFNWWIKSFPPNKKLEELQEQLVEFMLPSEENPNVHKEIVKVSIGDKNHINEVCLSVENDKNLPVKDVVFIHGFGASLGCFARNFQLINRLDDGKFNYRIHFLDNISFGLSSNPMLRDIPMIKIPDLKLNDSIPPEKTQLYKKYYKLIDSYEVDIPAMRHYIVHSKPILEKIDSYYIDAIDAWRKNSDIEKFILVGHSYGGYYSSTYAVNYSQHIEKLILLSPTGVERHALAVTNPIIEDHKDEKTVVVTPTLNSSKFNFLSRLPILSKKFQTLWFMQIFASKLYNLAGPFAPWYYYKFWAFKLFRVKKLTKKFGDASNHNEKMFGSQAEVSLIIRYLYNVIRRPNQSEFFIRDVLTPSTVAKYPLYDKFENFYKSDIPNKNLFKIYFLYGEYDYMNPEAGHMLSTDINKWNNDLFLSHYYKVNHGGHNFYLDNPYESNTLISKIIKED